MAYIHEVGFDIFPEEMEQLRIGAALERTLGYLRTLLPNQPGYITARAMFSLDRPETIHLIFQSVWETWDELEAHANSRLAEYQVLEDFEPHVELEEISVHLYQEVE